MDLGWCPGLFFAFRNMPWRVLVVWYDLKVTTGDPHDLGLCLWSRHPPSGVGEEQHRYWCASCSTVPCLGRVRSPWYDLIVHHWTTCLKSSGLTTFRCLLWWQRKITKNHPKTTKIRIGTMIPTVSCPVITIDHDWNCCCLHHRNDASRS